ncbi:hypothetical protein KKH39_05200 [Patescibacteria group bacterium]|nr:hypothetical protein [Patescibacteria group bacterium]
MSSKKWHGLFEPSNRGDLDWLQRVAVILGIVPSPRTNDSTISKEAKTQKEKS